ncbi:hypothetical protein [Agromyces bauzanensis]
MLTKTRALIVALVAIAAFLVPAAPSVAAPPDCDVIELNCEIIIELPEEPGDPETDPVSGVTPGPAECLRRIAEGQYEKVPCTSDRGSWSNASQCYWSYMDPQMPPPAGADPTGAWYECSGFGEYVTGSWLTTPPPGLGLTPGQAAARIIQTMTFQGLDIGMAPQVNPDWGYRRSYVGVPIWLWAENRTAQNWGPYVVTATLGGQTITVNAKVTSVLWNMGDGGTVACANEGTEYRLEYGFTNSPTCGYLYERMSRDAATGRFTVTATSQWAVDWTGGGQSGSVPLAATSTDTVEIRELQSVNVTPLG